MSPPERLLLVATGFHALPALVWGIISLNYWRHLRARKRRRPLFWILPLLTTCMGLHYALHTLVALTPTGFGGAVPTLHRTLQALIDGCIVATVALFRHLVPLLAVPGTPRRPRWLALHYGTAVAVGAVALAPLVVSPAIAAAPWFAPRDVAMVYAFAMLGLSLVDVRRLSREGHWPRDYDVAFNATLVVSLGVLGALGTLGLGDVLFGLRGRLMDNPIGFTLLVHTAFGLAFAAPFAIAWLAGLLQALFVSLVVVAAAGLAYFVLPARTAAVADPELRRLLGLAGLGGLVLLLGPARAWLDAAVERVVFRHRRRCREELEAFLHTLAPELGVVECCRRALAEVTRVMQLRGAAALLVPDRTVVRHGALDLDPIERAWPAAAGDTLPADAFGMYDLDDPALRAALAAAHFPLVLPLVSPRERWGHVFVSERLLGQATRDDAHVATLEAFAAQLAAALDAAALLARAVAVERSLAHAEKLAAIGELAARIAHEIRNPVTAARSLAQQLAREAASPSASEHALILAELERVERQVAALLRFARREEFHFEPVDLAALARATAERFRPRLEAAGVALAVDLREGVLARADRDKIRQVLINVLENAIDALAETPGARRLSLDLGVLDGMAALSVRDNGPGVPADALPHLFEPFFSRKPHGTGLGLAIARRTVEVHGGRIAVESARGRGTTVRVELPLGDPGGRQGGPA